MDREKTRTEELSKVLQIRKFSKKRKAIIHTVTSSSIVDTQVPMRITKLKRLSVS